jgi:Leucine-rich repeat (LRR) protein
VQRLLHILAMGAVSLNTIICAAAAVIRRLEICNNSLTRLRALQGCPLVSYLKVEGNKLTGEGLDGVRSLPGLTVLNAAHNEVRTALLTGHLQCSCCICHCATLTRCQCVAATHHQIKRIPPAVFSRFEGLQVLVLNNNSIDAVPHAWWKKGLHGLNTLVLSHNRVASLSDSGLSKLTLLTKLSASHNQLTELPDLTACTLLQELRLGYNRLASNI